jgi:diguanylate cyclase
MAARGVMSSGFTLLARSGLARRTFVVLAIALTGVMLGVLWFATHWSRGYADTQLQREASAASKQYGLAVFERLDLAATALDNATVLEGFPADALTRYFDSVAVAPLGSSQSTVARTGERGVGLHVDRAQDGRFDVKLIARRASGTIVARLAPSYLWAREAIPESHRISVVNSEGMLLFEHTDRRDRETQSAVGDWRVAVWPLFLRERFGAGAWQVRLSVSSSEQKRSLSQFRRALLLSLLPMFACLGLCASVLIRRSHRPLERLSAATRRLADGDFDTLVTETGDADSRALIRAFNHMARRIGWHWRSIELLSRLDRSILAAPDFERTTQLALRDGVDILRCNAMALLLLDSADGQGAQLLMLDGERLRHHAVQVPEQWLQRMRSDAVHGVDYGGPDAHCLQPLWRDASVRFLRLVPIRDEAALRGALIAGRIDAQSGDDDTRANERHLAERLAVALSSADRNRALVRNALVDDLTQLANRRHFLDRVAHEVALGKAAGSRFALLFLDLDGFKFVNDAVGHGAGDRLLQQVAERLRTRLSPDDFIARLGGDEFTIVVPAVADLHTAAERAQAVLRVLAEPIVLQDHEHVVSASIGIAVYPIHGTDAESLLRNADTAMYSAKHAGKRRYAFFEHAMNADAVQRVRLERDLRRAVKEHQLVLHYQPQIDLDTGEMVGAEALLRWAHPELGLIAPDRFLAIAEESGLMLPIGDWVLNAACEQYRRWRREGVRLERIAVNASVAQISSPYFARDVATAMRAHDIGHGVLEIEITETALVRDVDAMERLLNELRAMGVTIAIDDFGVGYSSLSYLQRLPIDILKIDRSFMPAAAQIVGNSGALCETIIAMSHALRKHVIAEGVEAQSQVQFLRQRGCRIAQGYYFSKPLTAEAFTAFYRARECATNETSPNAA